MADVSMLLKKLEQGTATQEDLQKYASRLGQNAGREIADLLKAGEIEDAAALVLQRLWSGYEDVTEYADGVQDRLYEEIGVGLRPVSPEFDRAKAKTLADEIAEMDREELKPSAVSAKTEPFTQDVADRHMSANAAAASKAGLTVTVSRRYDGVGLRRRTIACQWCLDRECTSLPYQEAYDRGVFQRHDGCHCVITYTNEKGETTIQSAKGGWTRADESGNIEKRKEFGLGDDLPVSRPELIRRMEAGKNDPENQGVIAQRILDGEYSLAYKHNKYVQHTKGTRLYEQVTRDRGRPQSYFTISEEQVIEISRLLAGSGVGVVDKNGVFANFEYATAPYVVGKYFEEGDWHKTARVKIMYAHDGMHIVPVKNPYAKSE